MSESDRDEQFRNIADGIIDQGNALLEERDPVLVSTAMLYGVARFCAFAISTQAEDKQNEYRHNYSSDD